MTYGGSPEQKLGCATEREKKVSYCPLYESIYVAHIVFTRHHVHSRRWSLSEYISTRNKTETALCWLAYYPNVSLITLEWMKSGAHRRRRSLVMLSERHSNQIGVRLPTHRRTRFFTPLGCRRLARMLSVAFNSRKKKSTTCGGSPHSMIGPAIGNVSVLR